MFGAQAVPGVSISCCKSDFLNYLKHYLVNHSVRFT